MAMIKQYDSLENAATVLANQYGVSKRQAYRYLKEAETVGREVAVPDEKIAFTVKLSQNLVQTVRQHGQAKGLTLSEIVTEALEVLLCKGRGCG